ncbi:DMT family transporter [Helicobacter sp. NHP21005]|uniref:DMT family transporter n=1 Tax=Helicobacter felistomachi TaxID=3040201 RepID=UPI0025739275|nr:DMT family transporter [Helicobacter sp. NHP21005]BEG58090.1 DMT family transporter [Helicobacter sp. NHP21005]
MFYLFALLAGMALALQAPINASLARDMGGVSVFAAFFSFLVGTLCLLVLSRVFHQIGSDTLKLLSHQEWWKFIGGLLGSFVVFTTIISAPKIGLAPMIIFLLVGQLCMGLFLDSIGAFGLAQKTISLSKILGLMLVIFGIFVFFYKDIFKA